MTARATTVEAATEALYGAFLADVKPPKSVKLRKKDRAIWRSVVRARARDEWSDIDLYHAANLVRCLTDIERISHEIVAEGDVVANPRGTQIVNPKHALLEVLSRRSVALTRLLHLHAGTLVDDPARLAQMREDEKTAREAKVDVDAADDGLLARPTSASLQ